MGGKKHMVVFNLNTKNAYLKLYVFWDNMLSKSLAKLPIGFESLLEDNIICIENRSTRENF
jgi:hypothetical protein